MEESIDRLCRSLASFSNHLESSCDALKQSINRRAIPLDSASSTFIQCLNRRVSSAGGELNLLESMSLGTVSFEELLGHCNEVYKNNQIHLLELQDHLKPLGFVPELEMDDEDELLNTNSSIALDTYSKIMSSNRGHVSLDDDDLFDESLSLKNIGLSNVCLASLASEENNKIDDLDVYLQEPIRNRSHDLKEQDYPTLGISKVKMHFDDEENDDVLKPVKALSSIKLVKDDYENLPSYMKGLASWEDLLTAVDKINSSLNQRNNGSNFFGQDEISSLGLGPKTRSYLLLLVRMDRLVVETINGLISYRIL
ncbi:DNA repair protein RAD50 [Humulus lupulus]|uniref:DNA repair protein RAD50 n=1 Tax=Humulus lupulus TaxID=3486 RepID=UPI002B40DD15|nr:DNA repair protein RAD50 [Humulus lupulus]